MAPPAVFFLIIAACFGYGWGSVIEDNYPSTPDHSWSIGDASDPITLNPNSTRRLNSSIPFELVRDLITKVTETEWMTKKAFEVFNRASKLRIFIDLVFYSWNQYQKEAMVSNYTNMTEDEQTTLEEKKESEGSTQKSTEELNSEQSTFEVVGGVATEAAVGVEHSDSEAPHRSRRFLKKLVQAMTMHPINLPEDPTTVSTSKKEYSFITNLKIDRGTAGVDYPDYADIPTTSFSCSDKTFIPGFYADLETGCQVFHVCWSDRRESLLCPVGTTFNQPLMKCDYWYNTNCSISPFFFDLNIHFPKETMKTDNLPSTSQNGNTATSEATNTNKASNKDGPSSDTKQPKEVYDEIELSTEDWNQITDFLPIKAKVTVYSKSYKHERKTSLEVPLPLRSASMSKEIQEKVRRIQVASRIVDGALGLAGRVAKGTAKLVMEVINHLAKSDEKSRKAEDAAKIVVEATDLAVKVVKDTAHLVNKFTLEAISHQAEKSASDPAKVEPEVKQSSTTQQKSREVNSRFVVKPLEALETLEHIQQSDLHSRNDANDHVLEIIDKAFEIVLGAKVLPATRQTILENYVKVALSKKSNF